ncbi:MAG: hypothetical protein SH850_25840 [Planctomycetaceae bacterium]|nr:hypothetical protein [Planctomycetaceae bacterium]
MKSKPETLLSTVEEIRIRKTFGPLLLQRELIQPMALIRHRWQAAFPDLPFSDHAMKAWAHDVKGTTFNEFDKLTLIEVADLLPRLGIETAMSKQPTCCIRFTKGGDPFCTCGESVRRPTSVQVRILQALAATYPAGLELRELRELNNDARKRLSELKGDPHWNQLIHFPGQKNRGGYRLSYFVEFPPFAYYLPTN